MKHLNKGLILILCLALVLLLITVEASFAQSSLQPPVPEFNVQYIVYFNYVPPTSIVDPYTGQTTTQGGYYTSSTPIIVITIKNQPFNSTYFQVRVKGHFSGDWTVITYWDVTAPRLQFPTQYPEQDYNSQYTVQQYHDNIPSNGQVDFQVQTCVGAIKNIANSDHWLVNLYQPDYQFTGQLSGWSGIQTLTIQQGSNSTATPSTLTSQSTSTQTPSPTLTVPEFSAIAILPLFALAPLIAMMLMRKRRI